MCSSRLFVFFFILAILSSSSFSFSSEIDSDQTDMEDDFYTIAKRLFDIEQKFADDLIIFFESMTQNSEFLMPTEEYVMYIPKL